MTTDKGLMVWLPLTDANHCENQGLVGKLTCITTPTLVDGGKLGKCLSTGAYKMSAAQTTKVFNNNHLTIAFWVYIDAATGASTPCSVFIGDGGNRKFMIMQYPTVNDLHCSWKNDATSNPFIADVISGVLPSYKWTHVAITYENPTAIIYINGVEVRRDTGVSNSSTFAYTTPIIGNNSGRRINDFRVYSYALSPQEIKELSKGKVGHWLCDGNGTFLPNVLGTPKVASQDYTKLSNNNWDISYRDSINMVRFYNLGMNGVAGPWVVSFTAWASTEYTTNIDLCDEGIKQIKIKTTPSKFFITATARNHYQTNGNNGFLDIGMPTSISKLYIRDLKMEKGTIPSAYSASNQAFLSDISGFGRHGQVVGNITLAGDTPRYDKSLKYNGGNVVVTGLPTMSTYTISWWDKFPADTDLLFDWRLGPVDTTIDSSSAGVAINNNTCYFKIGGVTTDYQNYSNYDITANTWYHCCLVCDDSKSRLYINGIQKWEANKGSIADFSQLILGGRNAAANDGYQYTGQHSDFRIYATALSADDVKELYSLGH